MFINEEPYKKMLDEVKAKREIIYLTYGGSHAYGTSIPTSDIDLRGIALKTKEELLGTQNFEQFLNQETDTTIYAVDKYFNLALNCNPNVIEFLGTKEEHKFLVHPLMQQIIDNQDMFLSRRAIASFGGYATAQLRRLENALGRNTTQGEKELHLSNTLRNMKEHLNKHYSSFKDSEFNIYVGESNKEDFEKEMFIDLNLKGYPLRDFKGVQSEMSSAIRCYEKLNHRNRKPEDKLDKHMMHLIRLYMMLTDILEQEKVVTYRENDIPVLMDIRNGVYSVDNYTPFYELLSKYEKRVEYAKENSSLKIRPDYKRAEEMLISINESSLSKGK